MRSFLDDMSPKRIWQVGIVVAAPATDTKGVLGCLAGLDLCLARTMSGFNSHTVHQSGKLFSCAVFPQPVIPWVASKNGVFAGLAEMD